jgi:hypothetical protein
MLLNKSYGYASLELSTPMPENAYLILVLLTNNLHCSLKLVEAKNFHWMMILPST